MSFCTKGIHARSCRIQHWYEWILRLRLAAVRRMTAWLELSRAYFRMKGGFSPLFIWISCFQQKVKSPNTDEFIALNSYQISLLKRVLSTAPPSASFHSEQSLRNPGGKSSPEIHSKTRSFWFWNEFPDWISLLGSAVIVLSGMMLMVGQWKGLFSAAKFDRNLKQ